MTYVTVYPQTCLSYGEYFQVSEDLWNDLSHNTYDGEGKSSFLIHIVSFTGFNERHEIQEDYVACLLFSSTLRGHTLQWCVTLHASSIHSLCHLVRDLTHVFYCYDHKELNKKIIELLKAPDESIEQFHICFCNLGFQFFLDEIDWKFLNE